jgi:hypothetical protein
MTISIGIYSDLKSNVVLDQRYSIDKFTDILKVLAIKNNEPYRVIYNKDTHEGLKEFILNSLPYKYILFEIDTFKDLLEQSDVIIHFKSDININPINEHTQNFIETLCHTSYYIVYVPCLID